MKKIKVATIGCRGHWSYMPKEIDLFPELDWCALSSGCADAPDRMISAAAAHGRSPKVYADWRELLERERPELAVIDGPFEEHETMTITALQAGCHVLCDKPAALDLAGLERVRAACLAAPDLVFMSMMEMRCAAPFAAAAAAVKSGAVGKVKMVSARKSYKLGTRPLFYRTRATYGGTIPWVGSHALDWIMWFGGAGFADVEAFHDATDNRGTGDLEVTGVVICRLANGVVGSAHLDMLRPQAAPTHGDDRVRIIGTEGVVEVERGKVLLIDAQGERELPAPPREGIFANFVRAALEGKPPISSVAETLELTRGCLLARDAADRRNSR